MGTNFFQKLGGGGGGIFNKLLGPLDPLAYFSGPHSAVSGILNKLPGSSTVANIDPALAANRDAYAAEHQNAPVGYAPYAGKTPTLADANNEYLNAAVSAGNTAAQNRQPAVQPVAQPTRSPLMPAMWSGGNQNGNYYGQ